MDSQDSSAPPPHPHHHPQPPFPANHAMLMGQYNPIQQHPSNNSYPLPNSNNSVAPTNSSAPSSAMMHQHNPRFPLNSVTVAAAAQKPMDHQYSDGSPSGSGGAWFNSEPAKKKRGRPRKYSHDNSIGLGLSAAPVTQVPSAAGHLDSGSGGGIQASETPNKRHRGRPSGSVKRQLDALGVPGIGFTPHVITVNSGEDIASKIMAFSQQGPRTVCILSATGAICNVTLHQPATSGGIVTYEGRFEIISLSGSFMVSESNGSQSGSLTVSLAGSDGRVLGGGVVGMLKAASPVQIVVGSFIAEGGKKSKAGPSPTPPLNMLNFATPGTRGSPCTPGGSSDSEEDNDDDDGSPLDHPGPGPYANAGQAVHDVPIYSSMGWPNPIKMHPN